MGAACCSKKVANPNMDPKNKLNPRVSPTDEFSSSSSEENPQPTNNKKSKKPVKVTVSEIKAWLRVDMILKVMSISEVENRRVAIVGDTSGCM